MAPPGVEKIFFEFFLRFDAIARGTYGNHATHASAENIQVRR
jgi:hypothetical protein